MPTSVRLSESTEQRLDQLAKKTGRSKAFYIREMIERVLPEMEAVYLAEARLEGIRSGKSETVSLEDLERELDL
ncbi:ribbon-helix-helix protein, CopG family [Vibrio diabolicus]|uniref:type II toxin-antitoxin system RelB family antitoxin n=1 Tax=Vibrio harveyi group TaxID=717610 RepID=UPI0013032800|nr:MULTISPECIES: ribbon-helix-helix protein, CopG family [Vibrio harveyi group]MCS0383034.1 ribbon-helix-helix protein, CopG family [Vibrio diabolicus]